MSKVTLHFVWGHSSRKQTVHWSLPNINLNFATGDGMCLRAKRRMTRLIQKLEFKETRFLVLTGDRIGKDLQKSALNPGKSHMQHILFLSVYLKTVFTPLEKFRRSIITCHKKLIWCIHMSSVLHMWASCARTLCLV